MSTTGRRWLGKRYPTIRHLHDDLISEALVQITEHLLSQPTEFPPSWFQGGTPPPDDAHRFHGFVLTVLKRRVMDQFREDFRQLAKKIILEQTANHIHQTTSKSDGDLEREFDIQRTMKALLVVMANLSEENRLLLEEVALGGREQPYSASERQRVKRLRHQLLNELTAMLGHDPIKMLKTV